MSDHEHVVLRFSHKERAGNANEVRELVRGNGISYSNQYDAYYCSGCGEWVEPKCSDPACVFCHARPPRKFDGPALLRHRIKISRIGLVTGLAIIWIILGGNAYYLHTLNLGVPISSAMIMAALVISAIALFTFSSAFAKMPKVAQQGQLPAAEAVEKR